MTGFFSSSEIQRDRPIGFVSRCGACGLHKRCESPKMEPYGEGRKRVLVVGEAPGQHEDEEGRPFIGKAGRLLRRSLGEIGADLDRDAWTTNALVCRPPKNATPDEKQIEWCYPNLLRSLKRFEPRVVITLGRAALVSVLHGYWRNVEALERWVGWKIPLQEHWLCPTYHPSFLLRMKNGLMDRNFVNDLRHAFDIEEDPPQQPDWKKKIEILYDEDQVYEALRAIDRESEWAAVDYETNCLKPDYPNSQIVSCAVSNGRRTISYPWRGRAIEATGHFLKSERTQKIASNLKMEERWTLAKFGYGVSRWGWDTMIAAHCLDNRPGICGLKFQSFIKLGVPSYNEHIEPYLIGRGWYNQIRQIEIGQLLLYGGMDAILEYRLAMLQRREMGL